MQKLHAYDFGKNVLDLVSGYLKNSKQRMKINTTFSTWTDLIDSVPQGSVLGPLFFNIYLNDLFFFLQDINICNFADDTTSFVCNEILESVLDKLKIDNKLKFDSHTANICFKANQKLSVLNGLVGLVTFVRKRIHFKAYFESQFKYCP